MINITYLTIWYRVVTKI